MRHLVRLLAIGTLGARETGYFLQEFRDFIDTDPPERVQRMWIDRDVETELRPLVARRANLS